MKWNQAIDPYPWANCFLEMSRMSFEAKSKSRFLTNDKKSSNQFFSISDKLNNDEIARFAPTATQRTARPYDIHL